jgi:hypothetical protein
MRDHCNCGKSFSLSEWVRLPTAYYQTYSDSDGTVVQQAVHCPKCKSTIVSAELEIVRNVYGPEAKVAAVMDREYDIESTLEKVRRRQIARLWHLAIPLFRLVAA